MRIRKKNSDGIVHTFDSNGALTVDAYSLLKSSAFKRQLDAARVVVLKAGAGKGKRSEDEAEILETAAT